jgi:uncharacterized protein (DUF1501 family)
MSTRRDFLGAALSGSSLIALAPTVPGFLAGTARAAVPRRDGRVLVVLELGGGNDGINTVVPFADEGYAKHRKALRLAKDQLLKVNDQIGLHPSLRGFGIMLEAGQLVIAQGVSYPNPSRSHFQSAATWQLAHSVANRRHTSVDLYSSGFHPSSVRGIVRSELVVLSLSWAAFITR